MLIFILLKAGIYKLLYLIISFKIYFLKDKKIMSSKNERNYKIYLSE